MPEDTRKTYVIAMIANYFGIERNDVTSLVEHRSMKNFLDDMNCPLLSVTRSVKNVIDCSNEVWSNEF